MRMVQRGYRVRLALESRAELLGGDLDGDGAAQAGIASFVHFPHAALGDQLKDFVGPEFVSARQRHDCQPSLSRRVRRWGKS